MDKFSLFFYWISFCRPYEELIGRKGLSYVVMGSTLLAGEA